MRSRNRRSISVLVIEDDEAVRRVLTRGLERDGYAVMEASGESRIEFDAETKLQVLVCDIGLPHENGFSISQRCHRAFPDCEIILLSGHPADELIRRGVPPDAKVVQKPIRARDLSNMIDQLLTYRAWRSFRIEEEDC